MASASKTTYSDPYEDFRRRILAIAATVRDVSTPQEEVLHDPEGVVVQGVDLYMTDPANNHDKVYKLRLILLPDQTYTVKGYHGRRGGTLKEVKKVVGTSLGTAQAEYRKVYNEKVIVKHYTESKDGGISKR